MPSSASPPIASIALANVRLRDRLAAAEARFRSLFEASPDAIVVATGDGTIVDANAGAADLFRTDRRASSVGR